jgi:hypothetical protein
MGRTHPFCSAISQAERTLIGVMDAPRRHTTLFDAYRDRYSKMPTVAPVLRALPDPVDHPIFRITTSYPANTSPHPVG